MLRKELHYPLLFASVSVFLRGHFGVFLLVSEETMRQLQPRTLRNPLPRCPMMRISTVRQLRFKLNFQRKFAASGTISKTRENGYSFVQQIHTFLYAANAQKLHKTSSLILCMEVQGHQTSMLCPGFCIQISVLAGCYTKIRTDNYWNRYLLEQSAINWLSYFVFGRHLDMYRICVLQFKIGNEVA